jgi:hypothetical protein
MLLDTDELVEFKETLVGVQDFLKKLMDYFGWIFKYTQFQ